MGAQKKKSKAGAGAVSKPADTSHADITRQLIRALEDLENRPPPSQEQLAEQAYEKLQFDLPVLSVAELDALSAELRARLGSSKVAAEVPPLTHTMLSNITQAVLASTKTSHPGRSQDTGPAATESGAASTDRAGSLGLLEVTGTSHPDLAAAYQRLSAVLLLDVVNSLLQLPVPDMCTALASYSTDSLEVSMASPEVKALPQDNGTSPAAQTTGDAAQQVGTGLLEQQVIAATAAALGSLSPGDEDGRPEQGDVYAADSDDDDMAYEPLEVAPASSSMQLQANATPGLQPGQQAAGANSWQRGQQGVFGSHSARLGRSMHPMTSGLGLGDVGLFSAGVATDSAASDWQLALVRLRGMTRGEHLTALTLPLGGRPLVADSSISQATGTGSMVQPATGSASQQTGTAAASANSPCMLWEDVCVTGALVQLLRTLGVHDRASDLQPVLQSYLGMVVEWAAVAQPGCLETLLAEVWDALGVTRVVSLPRSTRPTAGRGGVRTPVLLPEARMTLAMVVHISGKVANNTASRSALWRTVHSHLLPVLERCLVDVAAAAKSLGITAPQSAAKAGPATSNGTGTGGSRGDSEPKVEVCESLSLACQVVAWYLENRPGGVDAAATLQTAGVLRALCALWPVLGSDPAAEAMRCALLLCCAISPASLSWTLAVPGVRQALMQWVSAEASGGLAAHGVVWQVLLSPDAGNKIAGAGVSGDQLLSLLQGAATVKDPAQVQLLHDSLQLLARAWRACDRSRRIQWAPALQAAMRDALARLKAQQQGPQQLAQPQQNTPLSTESTPAQHTGVTAAEGSEVREEEAEGHTLVALSTLQVRQWEHGSAVCLKELMVSGSKAD